LLERRPQTQAKKSVPPGSAVPATSISPAAVTPDQIIDYLIRQFAEVTKLPLAQIHADEPIENYGVDSIMVTTFAQMLEHDLGELSKTLLFEYPTIEALADNLLKNHAATFAALFGTMAAQNVEKSASSGFEAPESVEKRATDSS
jgi:acyl carrier protein